MSANGSENLIVTDKRPAEFDRNDAEEDMAMAFSKLSAGDLLKVGNEHKHGMTMWNSLGYDYWDVASIFVKGGHGGDGCKAWLRDKVNAWGGPAGGNGGKGGNVILKAVAGTRLEWLKANGPKFFANAGSIGGKQDKHGGNGEDLILHVPPGTVVWVRDNWKEGTEYKQDVLPGENQLIKKKEEIAKRHFVGEMLVDGQELLVARGGRGGLGNAAFETHHSTAPNLFTHGEPGKGRFIELEVKLQADVGIIGVPNAGKSSFLNAITAKKPKIAAYPFSTTQPNCGQWEHDIHGGLTMIDVPGLIEGASEGRGMGHMFLRHVERCKSLIHVISGDSEDPIGDYEAVQKELRSYSTAVAMKPQVVVVNKTDITEVKELLPELMAELRRRAGHSRVFDISAATKYNCDEFMQRVHKWHKSIVMKEWKEAGGAPADDAHLIVDRRRLTHYGVPLPAAVNKEPITIDQELPTGNSRPKYEARVEYDVLSKAWRLLHPEVEKIGKTTNWDFEGGLERFNKVCKATGMTTAMAAAGLKQGDVVIVGKHSFEYAPEMIGQEAGMLIQRIELEEWDPERPNRHNGRYDKFTWTKKKEKKKWDGQEPEWWGHKRPDYEQEPTPNYNHNFH